MPTLLENQHRPEPAASQKCNGDGSASEAADTVALLQLQSPAQQHQDSSIDQSQQHQRATEASANSNSQDGQCMQSSKGKKAKKSKRDYAAWAGATAETRALATAHHDGNPDLDTVAVPSARPRIPKQSKLDSMAQQRCMHMCICALSCDQRVAMLVWIPVTQAVAAARQIKCGRLSATDRTVCQKQGELCLTGSSAVMPILQAKTCSTQTIHQSQAELHIVCLTS